MEIVASESGLLIASEGADEHHVGALLRRHDPDLRLVPRWDQERGCRCWYVYRYNGPDKPSDVVCVWQTREGVPLPLSSNLLELVQLHDRNTIGKQGDPDVANAQLKASIAKRKADDAEAIIGDWEHAGTTVLPRSQALRMSRDKQRARGKKV
jgi:hypothetical protein